jgi:hypothetical protein
MPDETHKLEAWMSTILAESGADLSELARTGYAEHGRGAVFIWPRDGGDGGSQFKASYVPASSAAFEHAGEHPKDKAARYDPEQQYVAVFLDEEQNALRSRAAVRGGFSRRGAERADGAGGARRHGMIPLSVAADPIPDLR